VELKLRGDFNDVLGAMPTLAAQQRARRAVRQLEISAVLGNGALSRTGSFTENTHNNSSSSGGSSGTGTTGGGTASSAAAGSPKKSANYARSHSSSGHTGTTSSTLVVDGNGLSKSKSFTGYDGGVRSCVAFSAETLEELACGASLVYASRGGGVDAHACAAHLARLVHHGNVVSVWVHAVVVVFSTLGYPTILARHPYTLSVVRCRSSISLIEKHVEVHESKKKHKPHLSALVYHTRTRTQETRHKRCS